MLLPTIGMRESSCENGAAALRKDFRFGKWGYVRNAIALRRTTLLQRELRRVRGLLVADVLPLQAPPTGVVFYFAAGRHHCDRACEPQGGNALPTKFGVLTIAQLARGAGMGVRAAAQSRGVRAHEPRGLPTSEFYTRTAPSCGHCCRYHVSPKVTLV